jgi:four helix bundle protein
MYNFEKLIVWKKAISLVEYVYKTQVKLPKEERFELGSQLRRAVTSIPLNIAEGSGNPSRKVFKQHVTIARGSLYEVVAILKIINKVYRIDVKDSLVFCDNVGRLLSGLIKSLTTNN